MVCFLTDELTVPYGQLSGSESRCANLSSGEMKNGNLTIPFGYFTVVLIFGAQKKHTKHPVREVEDTHSIKFPQMLKKKRRNELWKS